MPEQKQSAQQNTPDITLGRAAAENRYDSALFTAEQTRMSDKLMREASRTTLDLFRQYGFTAI